jgi:hypothetical protein
LSDFKKAAPQSEIGATKASARLPGLNIEIVHRQSPDGDSEQISISLQAAPSFEAFGHFLEAANPLLSGFRSASWRGSPGSKPCAPRCCALAPHLRCQRPARTPSHVYRKNGIRHSSAVAALGHAPARARVIVSHTREGVAGMSM